LDNQQAKSGIRAVLILADRHVMISSRHM